MPTTSRPMLSFTHMIFCGLQKSLKEKLAALPADSPPELVEGLMKAHQKLSDYYYMYDQSPFYIWASSRFNFKKLRKEYAHDPELSKYLEEQKSLQTYFDKHYPAATMSKPSAATVTAVDGAGSSCPKVINFAVFDQGSDNEDEHDELDSYFNAPRIGLDANPVQWWYADKQAIWPLESHQ
ncbi:hypothetical protein DFH08DRAFT_811283 [Mycena albidolilacea]|uniref:Uncharacterized protein n=1 Tax=Mycena albidolilacea TaxID=1033008 RepID=A0AAD6ZWH2_9AGAR|nr:hypothetical protein DFH08DRAFT_811283 [Mycena albidolilacea]